MEVRKAFREKAKNIHPDVNRNHNANGDFQRLNEAYQVLIDSHKRSIYDVRLKHGMHSEKIHYRPGNVYYRGNGSKYARKEYEENTNPSATRFEKYFDLFLFLTLTLAGSYSLFYGLYRLIINPTEEVNPYPGIVLGIVFTSLMIVVWNKKIKMLDN